MTPRAPGWWRTERLVERYFKDKVEGYDEPYQAPGTLDVCKRYSARIMLSLSYASIARKDKNLNPTPIFKSIIDIESRYEELY